MRSVNDFDTSYLFYYYIQIIYIYNYKAMIKKLFTFVLLVASLGVVNAANQEIECSSDPVFSEYSCNQCFEWGAKSQGWYIGLLSDEWRNASDNDKILYKEQQDFPEMVSLDSSSVEWMQTPWEEDFWEYTSDFDNLYSEDQAGYVLSAWSAVTWLKSKLSYAYKLERNELANWENIGLLIYPILTHTILDDGEITMDNSVHNECVLYKSGWPGEQEITEPRTLPQTWPADFFILLVLAMVLGFWVLSFKQIKD